MVQFQQQIGASLDDTYARHGSDGSDQNNPTSVIIEFGRDIGTGKPPILYYFHTFLRFLLNIPKGSTIDSAYLSLLAYYTRSDDFIAQINHTDEDDATDFSTNPWTRTDGGTDVPWTVPDFIDGQWVQTVDIKSLIQSFIDRAGYNENNHIAIRIKHGDAASTERQFAYALDYGNPANAAILTINYTPPGAPVGHSYSDGLVSIQVG